jgi:D-alanine-D-alanine ligase
MSRAKSVLVLRPASPEGEFRRERRGLRRYMLTIEGKPARPGKERSRRDVLTWFADKVGRISNLSSRKERVSASVSSVRTEAFPMLLPHRIRGQLLVTYYKKAMADSIEREVRDIFGRGPVKWELQMISDRPPMIERAANKRLQRALGSVADKWEIPFVGSTAIWPSAAGLSPPSTGVVCGLGPQARDLYTPREAVSRISFVQRTLLLSAFLYENGRKR